MNEIDAITKESINRFARQVQGKYDVLGLILFGSRARGSHRTDSDIDLAVLLGGEPQRMIPVKLEMKDLADDIYLEMGLDISPLPIWIVEWQHPEHYSKPELLKRIAIEGISLQF